MAFLPSELPSKIQSILSISSSFLHLIIFILQAASNLIYSELLGCFTLNFLISFFLIHTFFFIKYKLYDILILITNYICAAISIIYTLICISQISRGLHKVNPSIIGMLILFLLVSILEIGMAVFYTIRRKIIMKKEVVHS